MNMLVIYDSQFGNTERISRIIANTFSEFGQARAVRVDPTHPLELQGMDLLIIGCPTQGWRPTPTMSSFLEQIPRETLNGLRVACFDTRFRQPRWMTGSAAQGIARQLRKAGVEPIVPPESFFVMGTQGPLFDGEVERAARWAFGMHQQYEVQEAHLTAR